MLDIFEPLNSVIVVAAKAGAAKYISGEMNKVEAFEYADKLVSQWIETDEYKKAVQETWNKFADIKYVKFGEKVVFKYE